MSSQNAQPDSSHLPPTDPMLASALQGIEQGLGQIRRMSREADELKARLDAQQAALQQRENDLTDKLTALQAECLQLETDRKALDTERDAVERGRHAAEELARTADEKARTAEERAKAADARDAETRRNAEEFARRTADLDAREHAIQSSQSDFDAKRAQLDAKRAEFESQSREIAAERDRVQARATALADTERQIAQREQAATQTLAAAEQLRADTTKRAEDLKHVEDRAKRDQSDIALLRQSLTTAQQQASQTLRALQDATTRAEQAEQANMDLRAELDQASGSSADTTALARERDDLRQTAEDLRSKLKAAEDRESRLTTAARTLKEQAQSASTEIDTLKASLERAHAQATTNAQAASSAGQASAAASAAATAAAEKQIEELRTKLAEAEQAKTQVGSSQNAVQKELSDARLIIDDLRAQLEQHEKDSKDLENVLDQLRDRLRTEAAKTEAFASQTQQLEAKIEELESRPNTPQTLSTLEGAALPGPAAARLKRIELCRKLMRDKTKKVRRVSDALAKRYEQCEQILSLRQDVLAAKRSVEAAFRKQQGTEARGRAAATAFFIVAASTALAGASWLIAGQVAPEAFIAKAIVAADSPDRQLNAGELEEWTDYHEKLLNDPRFHDFAAQRLSRQGFPNLASPTAVNDKIKESIRTESNKPGELTLEMKGVGRERVERELQAISVALQSQSQALKDQRPDGAKTIISQAAKAGQEPLDSVRLVYGGAIFGGCMLVFGVLVGILWNRLAQAKFKFDQSQAVDTTDDDKLWPPLDRKAA